MMPHVPRRIGQLLLPCTLCLLMTACASIPEPTDTGHFEPRTLVYDNWTYKYEIFVPAHLQPAGMTPIVLFLHGSGERGNDGHDPTTSGLGPYLRDHRDDFPALVVFPQAPRHASWAGEPGDMAMAALDAVATEYQTDPSRTYLTGMSMGGYGTYELALRHPGRFAALVPVCGGIVQPNEREPLNVSVVAREKDPFAAAAKGIAGTPIWIFHGGDDDVVPTRQARHMAKAIKAAGGSVRYTEFPDDNHNSWDSTYNYAPMWAWMFGQKRG